MMFIKSFLVCWVVLGCLPFTAVAQVVPDRTLGEEGIIVQGSSGSVKIFARNINMARGAILGGLSEFDSGVAGNIRLDATEKIRIIRSAVQNYNNAGSDSIGASDIIINADSLLIVSSLNSNASILTSGEGGNAGDIRIYVRNSIHIRNAILSARLSRAGSLDALASSGDIIIQAGGRVSLSEESIITNNIADGSVGNAGDIRVSAESLLISDSLIFSQTQDNPEPSPSASVTIRFGGRIIVDVERDITIISTSADNNLFRAGISVRTEENTLVSGDANIEIYANSLSLENSLIDSQSQGTGEFKESIDSEENPLGNSGSISVSVSNDLNINNSSISTLSVEGSAGNVDITAGNMYLRDGTIQTVAFGTGAIEDNIVLTSDSIIASGESNILASAPSGEGGNIELDTPTFFGSGYQSARSGSDSDALSIAEQVLELLNNGRVDVNADGEFASGAISTPDTSAIQNSLADLSENAIDPDTLIANSCIARTETGGTF